MASSVAPEKLEEQFVFTAKLKKQLFIALGIGIVFLLIGIFTSMGAGEGHDHGSLTGEAADQLAMNTTGVAADSHGHGGASWLKRIWANMWINNVFFTGMALIGVFWVAIQYISKAGWSASFKRIPEQFGTFLPISAALTIGVFLLANHDIFHWTHTSLYEADSADFDEIINSKKGFFFNPFMGSEDIPSFPFFYLLRLVFFFGMWYMMYTFIRKESLDEDRNGGLTHYRRMVKLSGAFLVFFAVSSSISAWDWIMSIDTHWFSTMFGWYVFASWFAAGLALILMIIVLMKEAGYLEIVTEDHLHDMGKFLFAFSIFWTYVWFSQFLLIYYANIPEESVYFLERLQSPTYGKFIFINLIMNFLFPLLVLMTRDSKRKIAILKIVCPVVFIGHWFDFFVMISPGVLQESGGLGFMEIGMATIYLVAFLFVVLGNLSKVKLIPTNHPMLQESLHHHT